MEERGLDDGLQEGLGAEVLLGDPVKEGVEGLGHQAQIEPGQPQVGLGQGHGGALQGGGEEGPFPVHLP